MSRLERMMFAASKFVIGLVLLMVMLAGVALAPWLLKPCFVLMAAVLVGWLIVDVIELRSMRRANR